MANKVQIAVMMAVHGRIELTLHAIYNIEKLILDVTGTLPEIFTVCSDPDEFQELKDAGCTVAQCPNEPLNEKHNTLLNLAMQGAEWTHLLHLGSDNFITKHYLKKIIEAAKEGHNIIGSPSLSVIRPNQNKAVYYKYVMNALKVIGAGRLFSREVLENTMAYPHECTRVYYSFRRGDIVNIPKGMDYKGPFVQVSEEKTRYILWPYEANNGLDMQSMGVMANYSDVHVLDFEIPQIMDVKVNNSNITTWDRVYSPKNEVDYQNELARFGLNFLMNEAKES